MKFKTILLAVTTVMTQAVFVRDISPEGWICGFASADIRYPKDDPSPPDLEKEWSATAWRGETIHTQLVLRTPVRLNEVIVETGKLKKSGRGIIPASGISIGFLRYVLTDRLNDEGHGCGITPEMQAEVSLSPDAIDPVSKDAVEAETVQPFWVSVRIPGDAQPGIYHGHVRIRAGRKTVSLPYSVEVKNRLLPEPSEWRFHLDLWQNPYSVARYYDVAPWSEAHLKHMEPYMRMLASAGQKVITVSMIYDPWRGQTYDVYDSMIKWIKRADGSWDYDYGVFDLWVGYMMSLGIDRLVNCYTMVPWNNRFYYFDEASGTDTFLEAKTGTPEFNAHWEPMLNDFARHLKQKGWFGRTAIAMDERPVKDMTAVINLVKNVDPEFKVSLAGSYHPETGKDIFDYCIASAESWPEEVLASRIADGKPTTFYTYCYEGSPNTFTFSPSAEAAWMGLYAANKGLSGYLRWAYNCWPEDPLRDSRYGTWSGGDTYLIYPGPRSSVRFERMREGIQQYEKAAILKNEFLREGRTEDLRKLAAALSVFETAALETVPAADMVNNAKAVINDF